MFGASTVGGPRCLPRDDGAATAAGIGKHRDDHGGARGKVASEGEPTEALGSAVRGTSRPQR